MDAARSSRFLLRFDDICPTMNWNIWGSVELLLRERDLKPIIAVVPDNRDPNLVIESPRADFWDEVRKWQGWGWTIGLHGFQHRYVTKDPGLTGYKRDSEFAGLSESLQEEKLRNAVEKFNREEVVPTVWVAPSHSFDRVTVSVLRRLGIHIISDGFAFTPYYEDEMTWVPVQHQVLKRLGSGVWTICYHINSWQENDVVRFRSDLDTYMDSITSLQEVASASTRRRRDLLDKMLGAYVLARSRVSRFVRSRLQQFLK
jgi:predicted deacetylase